LLPCVLHCWPAPFVSYSALCTYPPPSAIYTLSLHDALPISGGRCEVQKENPSVQLKLLKRSFANFCISHGITSIIREIFGGDVEDRKSTRLNSSHVSTSYAVFCLK